MLKEKTFLVTGATGLIGSNIINKLLGMKNAHIIALSRSETKQKEMFSKHINNGSLECVAKDIGTDFDLPSITRNSPVDVIFHAASPISGKIITECPVDVIKPNLLATTSLLDGLVDQKHKTGINGRLIIFSSATVYGVNSQSDITVSEPDTQCSDGLNSGNAPYAESKRMTEVIARAYVKQYNVDAVIARLGWVYGATLYPPETAMFEFINNALRCEDIRFKSSGMPRRDNIHVDDAVSGLFTLMENGEAGDAYNISSGGALGNFAAIDEIAEIIAKVSCEELSNKIKVIYESQPAQSRKPGIIMGNSKLGALGWKPTVGLYEGLKNTVLGQKEYNTCRAQ
ncbi:MAG: NAD(P)-dependent oxidoreductase [Spirochaetaceae bacterium]|nr:NAD(P)-dependent oxidoreductase [Spirochaetaceae bacterium]